MPPKKNHKRKNNKSRSIKINFYFSANDPVTQRQNILTHQKIHICATKDLFRIHSAWRITGL